MKQCSKFFATAATFAAMTLLALPAQADQAGDTTVTIVGHSAGPTPFISRVQLTTDNVSAISSIQFSIAPKAGSVTRPISSTYTSAYLAQRGNLNAAAGEITVPVFELYDNFTNNVILTYLFNDGSSKQDELQIATPAFDDSCGYSTPQRILPRRSNISLSYDFILVKGQCSYSPIVLDSDGAIRWVAVAHTSDFPAIFLDNAVYACDGPRLLRMELDGNFSTVADYSSNGVIDLHHNIDPGKSGMLIHAIRPSRSSR